MWPTSSRVISQGGRQLVPEERSPERILVADGHVPREQANRAITDVAVGILVRRDGSFLMTTRPAGKVYPGYWEFPGGKVEAGETVEQALRRELNEELGIDIQSVQPVHMEQVDYPHALVRLHFCRIDAWQGDLAMREGQAFSWETVVPVSVQPVLPGAYPMLERMKSGI